ncbi:thermonuclease family protein [Ascidiaceihabitans sp.]|uniref:thermonuclease family protein n=2 Tax=Ascidiaceihabitans sp. TaxID=1872644 RepID=UPI00329785CA
MEVLFLILLLIVAIYLANPKGLKPRKYSAPPPEPKEAPAPQQEQVKPAAPKAQPQSQQRKKVDHAPPPPIPSSMEIKGKAWVIDGDTIAINRIKIRFAGIDAPELDQPWGQKSKWAMVKLCKGKVITVKLTGETSYDRLVGTCYLPDGRDLGAEIVKAGLALDGGLYSKGKYKDLEDPEMRRKLRGYGRWR